MANEFYIRKGLAIATASVATASGASQSTKYLVVGDDSIIRWATASVTSGVSGSNGTSGSSGSSGTSGTRGTSGSSGTSGTSGTSGASGSPGSPGSSGTSGTRGTSGTSGTSGASGSPGSPGSSGTSGTRGTSGTSGTRGTSGTSGTRGTSGTSGTSLSITGNWQYDSSTSHNTLVPFVGGFAYWQEGYVTPTLQPNLNLVNKIQITKSTVDGVDMEAWLKSLNGTGFTGTYNTLSYSYSKQLTKGYISLKNSSNVVHTFKVVSMGWYSDATTAPNDRPAGTSTFNSFTPVLNDPEYWIAVEDEGINGIVNIYVDYVGSTSYTSFSDTDSVVVSQSSTFPVAVASPAFSFQINNGLNPAGLDSFGLAINGRNSIHLNNYTRNIFGSTGSRDATVIGFNAGWTMSVATSSTFIGASAGAAIKTGISNTFIGAAAGMKGITGSNNVYVGAYSGFNNMKDSNVFIGANSGYSNNGYRNIFIGASAGSAAAAAAVNNSIAIGFNATPTADNQLVIASADFPLGTASSGVFSHYLSAKINGIDVKIPIYY